MPGITARLCRRFFAVYIVSTTLARVSSSAMNRVQSSLNGYASWVLGHGSLDDQIIAYSSLSVRPVPKLNLFEVGANLKVVEPQSRAVVPSKQRAAPRIKAEQAGAGC